MSSLVVKIVLRGYHVNMVMQEACIEESFIALHESGSDHDRCEMDLGVIKDM